MPPRTCGSRSAPDGSAEGYADVSVPEGGAPKAMVDLRVRPGAAEAMRVLFGWATGPRGGAGRRGGPDPVLRRREATRRLGELLEEAGYSVVRSSYEMERGIEGELEAPVWPAGLVVRPLDLRDSEAVHAAQDEAFAEDWFYHPVSHDTWLQELACCRCGLRPVVAWSGTAMRSPGSASDTAARTERTSSIGWIGDPRRPRARGAAAASGEALLLHSFRLFAEAGKQRAGLGVDRDNATGALALYERVGLRVVRRATRGSGAQ